MIPHSAGSILQNKERIKRVIFQNKKWDAEWFFKLKKKSGIILQNLKKILKDPLWMLLAR
jgi:hypothetical protein